MWKPRQVLDSVSDNILKAKAKGTSGSKSLLLLPANMEKLVASVIWGCSDYEMISGSGEKLQNYAAEIRLGIAGEQTVTYLGDY